jgi:hypothetical protein
MSIKNIQKKQNSKLEIKNRYGCLVEFTGKNVLFTWSVSRQECYSHCMNLRCLIDEECIDYSEYIREIVRNKNSNICYVSFDSSQFNDFFTKFEEDCEIYKIDKKAKEIGTNLLIKKAIYELEK